MFEVIYMKADYEPWWMFEGLGRNDSYHDAHFDDVTLAHEYCEGLLAELRGKHKNEAMKKDCFFAFWSDNENDSVKVCDEDLQCFMELSLMADGKPIFIRCAYNN